MSANRSGRTPLEELKKQFIDQPLHLLWGYATGILPWVVIHFSAAWSIVALILCIISCIIWAAREVYQAEDGSHTWWDPYLDSTVWLIGLLAGILTGIFAF